MVNNNNFKRKISNFFKGKGYYAALGLSVLMIGAASIFAYHKTNDKLSGQLSSVNDNTTSTSKETTDFADVAKNQTDVAKDAVKNDTTKAEKTEPAQTDTDETASSADAEDAYANNDADAEVVNSDSVIVIMPLNGEITTPFSGTDLVKSKTTGAWQTHNGIDIKGSLGDEVKAMMNGTVSEVNQDALWGITVVIDHGNGIQSRYSGLNSGVTVEAGTTVTAGTVIGAVGDTCEIELAKTPHLHFEIIQNNQYINPEEFISNAN